MITILYNNKTGDIERVASSTASRISKEHMIRNLDPNEYDILELEKGQCNPDIITDYNNYIITKDKNEELHVSERETPSMSFSDDCFYVDDPTMKLGKRRIVIPNRKYTVNIHFYNQNGECFYPIGKLRISDQAGNVILSDTQEYLDGDRNTFSFTMMPQRMAHSYLMVRFHRDYTKPRSGKFDRLKEFYRFDVVDNDKYRKLSEMPQYFIEPADDNSMEIPADGESAKKLKLSKRDINGNIVDDNDVVSLITDRGKLSTEETVLEKGEATFSLKSVNETVKATVSAFQNSETFDTIDGYASIRFFADSF